MNKIDYKKKKRSRITRINIRHGHINSVEHRIPISYRHCELGNALIPFVTAESQATLEDESLCDTWMEAILSMFFYTKLKSVTYSISQPSDIIYHYP